VKGGDCLAKWTGLVAGPVRRWRRVGEATREARREVWVRENGMFGVGEGEGRPFSVFWASVQGDGGRRL